MQTRSKTLSSLGALTVTIISFDDLTQNEPPYIDHAMKYPIWSKVVHVELQPLAVNGMWFVVPLPYG